MWWYKRYQVPLQTFPKLVKYQRLMVLQLTLVKHQILCFSLVSHKEGWLVGRTLNCVWCDTLTTNSGHNSTGTWKLHLCFEFNHYCWTTLTGLSECCTWCSFIRMFLPLRIINLKRVPGLQQSTVHWQELCNGLYSSSLKLRAHTNGAVLKFVFGTDQNSK